MSIQAMASPPEPLTLSTGVARRRAIFEEAVAAIEQSYDQDWLSVAELAKTIFTSKRHLQRAFAERGTSFQATLHAVRMERSAELLVESSLPVSQIAHLVGYRSPAQFAKAFRRQYQLAPTQLRTLDGDANSKEVISMDCKCGCQTPEPPPQGAPSQPRPKRDKHRDVERRLEAVDRRLQELAKAA